MIWVAAVGLLRFVTESDWNSLWWILNVSMIVRFYYKLNRVIHFNALHVLPLLQMHLLFVSFGQFSTDLTSDNHWYKLNILISFTFRETKCCLLVGVVIVEQTGLARGKKIKFIYQFIRVFVCWNWLNCLNVVIQNVLRTKTIYDLCSWCVWSGILSLIFHMILMWVFLRVWVM